MILSQKLACRYLAEGGTTVVSQPTSLHRLFKALENGFAHFFQICFDFSNDSFPLTGSSEMESSLETTGNCSSFERKSLRINTPEEHCFNYRKFLNILRYRKWHDRWLRPCFNECSIFVLALSLPSAPAHPVSLHEQTQEAASRQTCLFRFHNNECGLQEGDLLFP